MRNIKVILRQFVLLLTVFLCYSELFAQTVPMGLNYQAVARDQKGDELVNRTIDVRMSVISGNPTGMVEWEEIHSGLATNLFGLFTLVIGDGVRTGGTVSNFDEIPWSGDIHFLKVEIKFDQEFLDMGTAQFLSVPYALFSRKSLTPGPAGPTGPKGDKGDPGDPASDDQTLSLEDNILRISNGNSVTLNFDDADADPENEIQYLTLLGDSLLITKGNGVKLSDFVDDADADPENELQILSIEGRKLSISNGNYVMLQDSVRDDDADPSNELQNLSLDGYTLSISKGNIVTLRDSVRDDDADPTNEIQDLQLNGNILKITNKEDANNIYLNPYLDNTDEQEIHYDPITYKLYLEQGGDTIDLSGLINDEDADSGNEIQTFSKDGNTISLSKGGGTVVDEVNDADPDPGNELQIITISNDTIYLSNGGFVKLPADQVDDADPDPTNEIQDLQLIGNILTITINDTPAEIDLSDYLDDTDDQQISYDPGTNILSLENGGTSDLSDLRNIPLNGFRAEKNISKTIPSLTDTTLVFEIEISDHRNAYDPESGHFTAPSAGLYSFNLNYEATGDSQVLRIIKNGQLFEVTSNKLSTGQIVTVSFLLELDMGDSIWIQLNTGMGSTCG
ncbi:MAG: hypothetical protein KAX05_10315, partial [Bacteroidales bacterium]|nr:hypothetical protein [Bacteroidales bacterium]